LRSPREFKAAYARGRRLKAEHFTVVVLNNQLPIARLGLAVAARTVGNAVHRNRFKRLVRDSFRLHQVRLAGVDIVIGARNEAASASTVELRSALVSVWERIEKTCVH
jgi:ribonuclease P protein component